ncbi:MAG: hypothetical protein GX444_19900 [Myxococcales bacterium]|nr:hypothetical protein [Myxococcales bacterium]
MTRKNWGFALIGLGVALFLALVVSPHASSSPDGLERVAEDHGFLGKAEEQPPAWKNSPMPDYALPGVQSEGLSTGLAGIIGTLAVFALGTGVGLLVTRRNSAPAAAK